MISDRLGHLHKLEPEIFEALREIVVDEMQFVGRGTYVGRAGFVRCLPNGCIAEVVMDDELLKKLKAGQTATFIIFQTPEEGIGIPVDLKGFADGFAALP